MKVIIKSFSRQTWRDFDEFWKEEKLERFELMSLSDKFGITYKDREKHSSLFVCDRIVCEGNENPEVVENLPAEALYLYNRIRWFMCPFPGKRRKRIFKRKKS